MKAYPYMHKHPTSGQTTISEGMTLRDYFAAKAMQGLYSDPEWRIDMDFSDTAYAAYNQADAMMKQREIKEVSE